MAISILKKVFYNKKFTWAASPDRCVRCITGDLRLKLLSEQLG